MKTLIIACPIQNCDLHGAHYHKEKKQPFVGALRRQTESKGGRARNTNPWVRCDIAPANICAKNYLLGHGHNPSEVIVPESLSDKYSLPNTIVYPCDQGDFQGIQEDSGDAKAELESREWIELIETDLPNESVLRRPSFGDDSDETSPESEPVLRRPSLGDRDRKHSPVPLIEAELKECKLPPQSTSRKKEPKKTEPDRPSLSFSDQKENPRPTLAQIMHTESVTIFSRGKNDLRDSFVRRLMSFIPFVDKVDRPAINHPRDNNRHDIMQVRRSTLLGLNFLSRFRGGVRVHTEEDKTSDSFPLHDLGLNLRRDVEIFTMLKEKLLNDAEILKRPALDKDGKPFASLQNFLMKRCLDYKDGQDLLYLYWNQRPCVFDATLLYVYDQLLIRGVSLHSGTPVVGSLPLFRRRVVSLLPPSGATRTGKQGLRA
jgi:hypothetical protein